MTTVPYVKAGRVFLVSALLNLALVGWVAWESGRPPGTPETARPDPDPTAPRHRSPTASAGVPWVSPAVASWTNRFHWGAIETNDLVQFAANLRAIDCPENMVIELVSARARRALRRCEGDAEPTLPFWATGALRESTRRESFRQVVAARAQILARVDQALGSGNFIADTGWSERFVDQALLRFSTGPMSEESLHRLQRAFERDHDRLEILRMRADNVLLEADQLAMAQSVRQLRQEVAAALSPAEFEEYIARLGGINLHNSKVQWEATDISADELRQISLPRGRLAFENHEDWMNSVSFSEEEEVRLKEDLRDRIGMERFAKLERASNNDFKVLFNLGRNRNLPQDAALQAFEVRQTTAHTVAAMRADPSISTEDRQQRLSAIQAEAAAAIWKILGAEAGQEYLKWGGAWMTNVNHL